MLFWGSFNYIKLDQPVSSEYLKILLLHRFSLPSLPRPLIFSLLVLIPGFVVDFLPFVLTPGSVVNFFPLLPRVSWLSASSSHLLSLLLPPAAVSTEGNNKIPLRRWHVLIGDGRISERSSMFRSFARSKPFHALDTPCVSSSWLSKVSSFRQETCQSYYRNDPVKYNLGLKNFHGGYIVSTPLQTLSGFL